MQIGMIVDIVIVAILAIICLVSFFKGFLKSGFNDLLTAATIAVLVLVSPIIVNALLGVEFFANLAASISGSVGELAVQIILYVIAVIVLLIVMKIVTVILKKIVTKINFADSALFKLIDKLIGLGFALILYGVLLLTLRGIINTIIVDSAPLLQGGFLDSMNFMQAFCNEKLNLNALIEQVKGLIGLSGFLPGINA